MDFLDRLLSAPRPEWMKILARDRPIDPNSALVWLPRVDEAGGLSPTTCVIRIDPDAFWLAIGEANADDMPHAQPIDWDALRAGALLVGLPCFIRTDLSSAKHAGPEHYRLDRIEDIERVVLRAFGDNCMKDLASGPTPLRAILFRQWIDLDAPFAAFGYGGAQHPIAHEWRIFAGGGRPPCSHFYWPEGAIEDHDPSRDDWRTLRAEMEQIAPAALTALVKRAERVAKSIDNHRWSVDFARDRDGAWWLIDMARAESSWHPTCSPVTP